MSHTVVVRRSALRGRVFYHSPPPAEIIYLQKVDAAIKQNANDNLTRAHKIEKSPDTAVPQKNQLIAKHMMTVKAVIMNAFTSFHVDALLS